MKSVVDFSIKQTVFINVVFVILVVAGVFSLGTTPVENMPKVEMGRVFIHTPYFGASAEDVENLITTKIEDALDGLENIEYIQSHSFRNFSSVGIKFVDDTDYRDLYDELRFRVMNVRDELPAMADESSFLFIETDVWKPVIIVNIAGAIPERSLKRMADELKSRLLSVPDVKQVYLLGAYANEFHVSVDPSKLRKQGITFAEVAAAVRSSNTKIPTGRFRKKDSEYMLDAGKRLATQAEVLQVIVRKDGDGNFIRVRDLVTNARLSHRDPLTILSVNGMNTLRLQVTKQESGNAVTISEAIKKAARDFEADYGQKEGIKIIFTHDSTIEIKESVEVLLGNLVLGMILVTLVLWISLGFRNAMLTAVGIPFSFLCTFLIMKIAGVSINTISLFAFVLVTGIIVDDAVIIMENIFRHLQMGKLARIAVVDGTAEVMLPVISSALTTILAFIPMLIMTGTTGQFFAEIPKTVTFALLASLLEALFILPIHILDWGPKKKKSSAPKGDATQTENPYHHLRKGIFALLWQGYRIVVVRFLNHKLLSLFGITALFIASLMILILSITGIVPLIPVQFFPSNYFRYHVAVIMPPGTALEQTDKTVRDISSYIMSLGEGQAQSASGTTGFYEDEDYIRHSGHRYGQVIVTLPHEAQRRFPENPTNDPMLHLDYIRKKINRYVAEAFPDKPQEPEIKIFEESEGPPTGKPVNIRVTAVTMEDAVEAADQLKSYMGTLPELADLIELQDNRPSYQKIVKFVPREDRILEYGLRSGEVTAIVAGALNGQYAGQFRTIDEEVDLLVRLSRTDDVANPQAKGLFDPTDILDLPVVEDSAAPVMLRDLVEVSYGLEPESRSRYKGRPCVTITAGIKTASKLSPTRVQLIVSQYLRAHRDRLKGASLSFGGEFESTAKSYTSLGFAFLIAILGIYLVLSSQFGNYFQPLIIITAVPFALIGVTMGLFLTRLPFTVGSFMAVIGLAGVAVNDSLLLVDFMNKRMQLGKTVREAVMESCAARMRPVLITTVTTALGLLPMAIGFPNKSLAWSPMAMSFVAGLSSATLLALLFIPVEYELFETIKSWLRKKKGKS